MLVLLLIVLSSCQSQDLGFNQKDVDSFAVEDGSSVSTFKGSIESNSNKKKPKKPMCVCPPNGKQGTGDPCQDKFADAKAACGTTNYCDQLLTQFTSDSDCQQQ